MEPDFSERKSILQIEISFSQSNPISAKIKFLSLKLGFLTSTRLSYSETEILGFLAKFRLVFIKLRCSETESRHWL